MKNVELSYEAHKKNFLNLSNEKDERLFHIKNKDCFNYQIIKRTLDIVSPFMSEPKTWLTIGDYNGLEANYLLSNNQIATASDISESFLPDAKNENLINDFCVVNVEKMQFADNSFDYVFCKEAFHHFPKAYLGLYEMIRCSKIATIMIEPIDVLAKMPILLFLKNFLDVFDNKLINKIWKNRFSFEIVGNYVFKISEREIEKIAMGMGLRCIAFRRINLVLNYKTPRNLLNQVPLNKKHWNKNMRRIAFLNLLSGLHLIPYNHLCCVVFKEMPDTKLLTELKKQKFEIITLPENPYLK